MELLWAVGVRRRVRQSGGGGQGEARYGGGSGWVSGGRQGAGPRWSYAWGGGEAGCYQRVAFAGQGKSGGATV